MIKPRTTLLWLACLLWLPLAAGAQLHHVLSVTVSPDQQAIEVHDSITLPERDSDTFIFALHPDLKPEALTPGADLREIPATEAPQAKAARAGGGSAITPRLFRVTLPADNTRFELRYAGRIRHELQPQNEAYARSFSETPGMIAPQGVFLSGNSYWYPRIDDQLLSFELELRLPEKWRGMTQGERVSVTGTDRGAGEHWRCQQPQEEIYLIAGPFTEYRQVSDEVQALVMLRQPDPALAQKYLDATDTYIRLYSELLGPYPFSKFALVENFWETGYGMPSFTLLGPKVIRFPFILHSSYPHEILHNWWGNGVYVDYGSGNWAEGLTSYLADHLIKEQRGQGTDYRRTVLQKYTDYVSRQQDFALTQFRGRHSASTEAVGYGKTLMLFHMLRRQLGDETFVQGLQQLYQRRRFQVTDFAALEQVFSEVAGQSLPAYFGQWVQRPGAPALRVSQAHAEARGAGYALSAVFEQTQPGAAYALRVPVAISLQGEQQAYQTDVILDRKRSTVELQLPARPLVLDVDPEFDVFRRLHRQEIPPAISQAMGAGEVLIVLPAGAPPELSAAYQALAKSWQTGRRDKIELVFDDALEQLPDDRAVWLFGWNNRFRSAIDTALSDYDYTAEGDRIRIGSTDLHTAEHAVVVMARQTENPEHALGWLAAGQAAALPGLGRKLPHYGRYSYLAFSGEAPDNILKGQWPVVGSPMSVQLAENDSRPRESAPAKLAPRRPLVAADGKFSRARMQADIAFLADPAMAGRGLATPELGRAADYLATQFRKAGLQPGGDGDGYLQQWQQQVAALDADVDLSNVIGVLPGSDPRHAGESLVVGAHYDHLGRGEFASRTVDRGRIHPGADDNASGLAVMLELARSLRGKPQPRSVVFVAFTGEETGRLGSRHYVQHAQRYPVDKVIAMLNLDTVGRLGDKPLTLFGTGSAEEWPHIFRGAAYVTGVPVNNVSDDFGSSDQSSFIAEGVPAVQLFGGAHEDIHRPGDRVDKVDLDGLVKVARVLQEAVTYLAGRPEALHSTLGDAQREPATRATPPARRVSLGTVPDFAYAGDGVRLEDVRPGTPAAQAGLSKGDIVIEVNGEPVRDMRDYGKALRQLEPGDEIRLRLRRDGREQTLTTRVVAR